jgi:hypothetical protein
MSWGVHSSSSQNWIIHACLAVLLAMHEHARFYTYSLLCRAANTRHTSV